MRNFYVFLCWDKRNELDVPWKLSLKMRSSKKTTSMFFFGGGWAGGEMDRGCHVNMEIPSCKKFANLIIILNQTRILCKKVVELCIYLCWGLAGPD